MSRFTLEKSFRFEAAHYLPLHDGKCQRLHGHSWVGTLIIEGDSLQLQGSKCGMLMDFGDLSKAVEYLREHYLDHHYLNETTELTDPTSEQLAVWIYNKLKATIPLLVAVRIEETCTSAAIYRPNVL